MSEGLSGVDVAHALLRIRRLREDHFPVDLVYEFASDILLALYIDEALARDTTETRVIEEAGLSPAAGRRWITHLEHMGSVERGDRPDVVRLTARGRTDMAKYLARAEQVLRN